MSAVSFHLGRGIRALRGALGSVVLEYRTTHGGSWVSPALIGIFRQDGVQPSWDQKTESEMLMETAHIDLDVDQAALHDGYEVRVAGDDAQVWAVSGGKSGAGHARYTLNRKLPAPGDQAGPNRGRRS